MDDGTMEMENLLGAVEKKYAFKQSLKCKKQPFQKHATLESAPGEGVFPLSGGISIPQHIVIPPSMGERGPDGTPLPQRFQINSEITINYDGHHTSLNSDPHESYKRYPVGLFGNSKPV
uniref:ZM domain-containing protein n=1 Tax=Angiostrongylus cantonensis TaxID=6313 RepID=A0A0K0CUG9_ANGCA